MNLFSTVYEQKPLAHQLTYDKENLEYIKSVLSDKNIAEYKIAIAYGSAHASNKNVVAMKMAVLDMIQKTFQSQQIYHIVTEYLSTENPIATHVLNLGLRHGDEKWILQKMDVKEELKKYKTIVTEGDTKKAGKDKATKVIESEKKSDVLKNN